MSGIARDASLVRAIGTWGMAANLISMIVGAGIFAVPSELAACIGPYGPLAFVVCGIAIGSVAVCLAEGGSRVPTSGGIYGSVEAAFGPRASYVTGNLLWLGDVLACGGVAAALAGVLAGVFPGAYQTPARVAVIVGVIGFVTLVNLGGVAKGARLVNVATLVKLLPLVVFVFAGVWAMHSENFSASTEPLKEGWGRAVLLALFALSGMEGSLNASGEIANPSKAIPRALGIAIGTTVLLYIAIQVVAQGILGPALAHSMSPLADAMGRVSPWLRVLMVAGAAISMFGWLAGDILATPRMLYAFAHDGLLPRVLGRVHAKSRVPHVAIMAYSGLALILALTGTFAELAVLSALATSVLYISGAAAALRLKRNGVAEAGVPLNFRWLKAAAAIGITSMVVMIVLASRAEILGLALVIAVSLAIYAVLERSRRVKKAVETPV